MECYEAIALPAWILLIVLPTLQHESDTMDNAGYLRCWVLMYHAIEHRERSISSHTLTKRRVTVRGLWEFYRGRPGLNPNEELSTKHGMSALDPI